MVSLSQLSNIEQMNLVSTTQPRTIYIFVVSNVLDSLVVGLSRMMIIIFDPSSVFSVHDGFESITVEGDIADDTELADATGPFRLWWGEF